MKVILCARNLNSSNGAGLYTLLLLKELSASKKISKVVVIGPKKLSSFGNKVEFVLIKLPNLTFILNELFFALKCVSKIGNLLKKNKYQLVITCQPFLIFGKLDSSLITIFHTFHRSYSRVPAKGDLKLYLAKLFHFFYSYFDFLTIKFSDRVVFVSKNTLEEASKYYSVYKNKFIHIPTFVNTTEFFPLMHTQKVKIRRKYGFSEQDRIILFVGRMDPLKGLDNLVEVVKVLNIKNDLKLVIVGEGKLKESIINNNFVVYLAMIPHKKMNEIYNMVDLFVLPSYYENSPITVLEAMSSGVVILASDVGDVNSLINSSGMIYKVNDKVEFQTKLLKLISSNAAIKNKMIKKLKRRAIKMYSSETILKTILGLVLSYSKSREKSRF